MAAPERNAAPEQGQVKRDRSVAAPERNSAPERGNTKKDRPAAAAERIAAPEQGKAARDRSATADAPHQNMGPPPPPASWSSAEVEAGAAECSRRLSNLPVLFDPLDPIREDACGLAAPIRLKGFARGREAGLSFSPAPTVSCKLAEALEHWFENIVQPNAKAHLNAPILRIASLSSYNCRARYGGHSERISEHAFANALDVSEFITDKGEHIGVLEHWNDRGERSAFLRAIHDGACEIFGTTLGPEANEAHKNHFHLDMKERRRPLCDFTPDQMRAREEAKRHPPVPVDATVKAKAGGGDEPGASGRGAQARSQEPAASPGKEEPGLKQGGKEAAPPETSRRRRGRRLRRYERY